MSRWTYVTGVITVDVISANSTDETIFRTNTAVHNLPRVTGSECDLQLHVNILDGHSYSSTTDAFGRPSNLYNDPVNRMFDTQTEAAITLYGELRDREFGETLREVTRMLNRLAGQLYVTNCLVQVRSSGGKTFVFQNPKWVLFRDQIRDGLILPRSE